MYKESLLRLRDAAHTKEDVELWKSHDLTNLSTCTLTVEERKLFESQSVHLFCENRRAGQFNGCRLGEDAARLMVAFFVFGQLTAHLVWKGTQVIIMVACAVRCISL